MERWIRSPYLVVWLLWCVTHMSYSSPCHTPYDISLVKPLLLKASLAASLFPGCLRVMDPFEYQRSPAPWVRNKWYQPHAADCRCCHSNTHSLLLLVPTPPVSKRAVTQRSSAVLRCFIHSYQPKWHTLASYRWNVPTHRSKWNMPLPLCDMRWCDGFVHNIFQVESGSKQQ